MVDGQVPGRDVPAPPGDTGVQRALGERRRRRVAERTGQVDLDATMSHWPVADPPTRPRPVVRPARPAVPGVADSPVLPTPGAMVVGPLLEARSATAPRVRREGSRRARRGAGGTVAAGSAGPDGGVGAAADPGTTAQDHVGTAHEPGPVTAAAAAGPAVGPPLHPPVHPAPDLADDLTDDLTDDLADRPGSGSAAGARVPGEPEDGPFPGPTGRRGAAAGSTPSPRPAPASPRALLAEVQAGGRRGWSDRLGRRGALLGVAAVLVVVLLVVVLAVSLRPDGDPAQAVADVPGVPAQRTLALALQDGGSGLVGAVLVGVDSAELSTLLLPQDLLLTVADAGGPVSMAEAAALGDEPVRRGLEDTLLLRVDAVGLLAPAQLVTLVDAVGGVVVDVTSEVVTDDVVVAVGDDQRLAGAQAVAYASLAVDGEPAEAGLARLGAVVQALLGALPVDADAAALALAQADLQVSGGVDDAALADLVAAAAARSTAGNAESVVLPTEELVAGEAALRGVDDDAARPQLASRFAGAQLPVAAVGEVRVQVRNAVGRPGLGAVARDLLVADGLRFAGSANAESFGDQPLSAVLVPSQGEDDRDRGEAVAAALGLGEDALQVNSETLVDTEVVVVLGDDFVPIAAEQTTDAGTAPGSTPPGEAP